MKHAPDLGVHVQGLAAASQTRHEAVGLDVSFAMHDDPIEQALSVAVHDDCDSVGLHDWHAFAVLVCPEATHWFAMKQLSDRRVLEHPSWPRQASWVQGMLSSQRFPSSTDALQLLSRPSHVSASGVAALHGERAP